MHVWRPSFICIVVFLYFLFASLWICILYNKKRSYCSGHFCTEYIAEHGKTHKILIIIIIMLVMMKVLFEKWPTARQVTFFPFPISNCSDLLLTFPLNIFDISPQTCSFQSCSCFQLILWQDLLCIAKGEHWQCVNFESFVIIINIITIANICIYVKLSLLDFYFLLFFPRACIWWNKNPKLFFKIQIKPKTFFSQMLVTLLTCDFAK